MSIWPGRLSVKVISQLMSWFSPSFSGALVNALALTLLLEIFARKSDSIAAFQLALPVLLTNIWKLFQKFQFATSIEIVMSLSPINHVMFLIINWITLNWVLRWFVFHRNHLHFVNFMKSINSNVVVLPAGKNVCLCWFFHCVELCRPTARYHIFNSACKSIKMFRKRLCSKRM